MKPFGGKRTEPVNLGGGIQDGWRVFAARRSFDISVAKRRRRDLFAVGPCSEEPCSSSLCARFGVSHGEDADLWLAVGQYA